MFMVKSVKLIVSLEKLMSQLIAPSNFGWVEVIKKYLLRFVEEFKLSFTQLLSEWKYLHISRFSWNSILNKSNLQNQSKSFLAYVHPNTKCYNLVVVSPKCHLCGLCKMINDCLNVLWCMFFDLDHSTHHSQASSHFYSNIMATFSHCFTSFNCFDCINWNWMVLWSNPPGGESYTWSSLCKSHRLQIWACYCKSMLRYKYVPWFRLHSFYALWN